MRKWSVILGMAVLAMMVVGIGLAQATETWNFGFSPDAALSNTQTFAGTGTPSGDVITAAGFDSAGNPTALHRKFTSGNADETGLGLQLDNPDHEITTSSYVQLDLANLNTKGFTKLTLTIGSIQSGEGYKIYSDTSADSIGSGSTLLRTFTGNGSSISDTFTYDLTGFRYLDIQANLANVLLESASATSAVPVPPTVLLLGSGLLGLVGLGWRSRKHT